MKGWARIRGKAYRKKRERKGVLVIIVMMDVAGERFLRCLRDPVPPPAPHESSVLLSLCFSCTLLKKAGLKFWMHWKRAHSGDEKKSRGRKCALQNGENYRFFFSPLPRCGRRRATKVITPFYNTRWSLVWIPVWTETVVRLWEFSPEVDLCVMGLCERMCRSMRPLPGGRHPVVPLCCGNTRLLGRGKGMTLDVHCFNRNFNVPVKNWNLKNEQNEQKSVRIKNWFSTVSNKEQNFQFQFLFRPRKL